MPLPRPAARRRPRGPAAFRPGVDPLEARTMLTTAIPRPAAAVAAVGAMSTATSSSSAAQDNRAYIDGLIGTDRLLNTAETALGRRLTTALDAGTPRDRVVAELLRSGPARALQVQTTYQRLLGRTPTPGELRAGVDLLRTGRDERALTVALLGSRAYRRGHANAAGLVDAIYGDVVRRTPTPSERDAALRLLARGGTAAGLARRLIGGSEAQALLLRGARGVTGPLDPGASPQDLRDIARPDGLVRITARALASDRVFRSIVQPAAPPTPTPTTSPSLPGFPIPPGFDLNSRVTRLNVGESTILISLNGIGVGADDVPWLATSGGLQVYNLQTGSSTSVLQGEKAYWVAPFNANEAYAIVDAGAGPGVYHVNGGIGLLLPSIPAGTPAQVGASPDGVVWVLNTSGQIFSYQAASDSWSSVSTDGYSIKQIAVGSATNIWAVTTGGVGLQYTPGRGFVPDPFLSQDVAAVAATADGAAWASGENYVFTRPSYGVWKITPKPPTSGLTVDFFAAGSMNRAFVAGPFTSPDSTLTARMEMISVGVVDRQPVPFPAYTGADQQAYLALSQAALIFDPAGVRGTYDTPGEDWGGLQSRIANAIRPSMIPVDSWNKVQNDLTAELLEVGTVYGRLQLIQSLMTQIQTVNDGALPAAASLVGLSQPYGSDRDAIIKLVLLGIFEAVAGAISSTGIPPAGAVVASMLASGFSTAVSDYESANHPDGQGAVSIQYSSLQTQLDTLFLQSIAQINSDITSIVSDRGKLSTVALAILNGEWPYINQTSTQIAAATAGAFNTYFYQSLMSVKWQVLRTRYGNYIKDPIDQILKLPAYAYYQVPLGYELGIPIEEVYVVNKLGGPTDLNSVNLGEIPIQQLFEALQALPGSAYNDFWVGNGNWSMIKRIKATL